MIDDIFKFKKRSINGAESLDLYNVIELRSALQLPVGTKPVQDIDYLEFCRTSKRLAEHNDLVSIRSKLSYAEFIKTTNQLKIDDFINSRVNISNLLISIITIVISVPIFTNFFSIILREIVIAFGIEPLPENILLFSSAILASITSIVISFSLGKSHSNGKTLFENLPFSHKKRASNKVYMDDVLNTVSVEYVQYCDQMLVNILKLSIDLKKQ